MVHLATPAISARSATVSVIDADELARRGCFAILDDAPGIRSVTAMDHDAALEVGGWEPGSVVLVDPVDRKQDGDQIPGAAVVERIRERAGRSVTVVVVSRAWPDDPVRRRMIEAGADRYVSHAELCTAAQLVRVVLAPQTASPVPQPVDDEQLLRLGITRRSRVNLGVRALYDECLVPEAGWVGPRGRDRLARRRRFNDHARLEPVGADGLAPGRPQEVPSLAQIQRFAAWATRVDARSPSSREVFR